MDSSSRVLLWGECGRKHCTRDTDNDNIPSRCCEFTQRAVMTGSKACKQPRCNAIKRSSEELTVTSLDAFPPCVIKIRVAGISTLVEPSTTASATTEFTGFLGSTALGAYGIDQRWRRRDKRRSHCARSPWGLDIDWQYDDRSIDSIHRKTRQAPPTIAANTSNSAASIASSVLVERTVTGGAYDQMLRQQTPVDINKQADNYTRGQNTLEGLSLAGLLDHDKFDLIRLVTIYFDRHWSVSKSFVTSSSRSWCVGCMTLNLYEIRG